ncbi:MAG TPA: hypothetical protein PLK12_06420, partial [Prolixibacteraceae bacterium]|nr:hypothetical protein [Prolixibacteraceae bacterium]
MRIFFACFFLFMVFLAFLFFFAEEPVKKYLTRTVSESSEYNYLLEIEDVRVNFLRRSFTFNEVLYHRDSGIPADSTRQIEKAGAQTFELRGIRLLPLIFHKKIHARKLWIDEPVLELNTHRKMDLELFASNKIQRGDSLIIPAFREIRVDSIVVSNARFSIDTLFSSREYAPTLKLIITDFRIGGIKETDTSFPFDVGDISLNLENLKSDLADQIHRVEAAEVSLSLLHSGLTARNVVLEPHSDLAYSNENQYRIAVPLVEIKSENLDQVGRSDSLNIQSVLLEQPVLEIKYGGKVVKGTPLNAINFFPLLKGKLNYLSIQHFSIQNADLKLYPPLSNEASQHLENLFLKLYNLEIDSGAYQNPERILSAEDLNISLERYTIFHSDKIHRFVLEKVKADSRSRRISTGNVSFEPLAPGRVPENETSLDIHSGGIIFKGIDFKAFYHNKILPMEELVVRSPEAQINLRGNEGKSFEGYNRNLLLNKTNDYLKGIYVDKAIIEQGSIHYSDPSSELKRGFFSSRFRFELDHLSIDNETFYRSDKIFFADHFKAWFSDLAVQLSDDFHRILIDSSFISSRNRTAEVFDLRILPVKPGSFSDSLFRTAQTEIYDVHFPRITLTGADLHRAFFKKELVVSGITIMEPYLNVESKETKIAKSKAPLDLYGLVKDLFRKIEIRHLTMNRGNLNMIQYRQGNKPIDISNRFDIDMKGFLLDSLSTNRPNKILYSDDIDLILTDQTFSLNDGVHRLSADAIGLLTSTNRIYLTNARLFPDVDAPAFRSLPLAYIISIPSIEFTGADINALLKNGHFFTEKMLISNPDIQVLTKPKNDSIPARSEPLTISGLNSLWVNQVTINRGYLELSEYETNKTKTYASGYVNFSLSSLKADFGKGAPAVRYNHLSTQL